jgi:hypothetical protein
VTIKRYKEKHRKLSFYAIPPLNFALTQLENVHHFWNLHNNFRLNAILHGRNVAALVLCWSLAKCDVTVTPSVSVRADCTGNTIMRLV